MSGKSNLPPGVTESMLPGNTREDAEREQYIEELFSDIWNVLKIHLPAELVKNDNFPEFLFISGMVGEGEPIIIDNLLEDLRLLMESREARREKRSIENERGYRRENLYYDQLNFEDWFLERGHIIPPETLDTIW